MKLTTKALAAVLTLAMAISAQAVHIQGAISFSGDAVLTPGSVATATAVDFTGAPNARATAADGDYAGVPTGLSGQLATFTDFTFAPFAAIPVLWTFDYNGWTYSMSALTLTELDRSTSTNPPILNLKGVGIATITGPGSPFEATEGVWSVSVTQAGTTFGFASSAIVNPVPDNGATAALLGLSLIGVALVSRKLGGASMLKA